MRVAFSFWCLVASFSWLFGQGLPGSGIELSGSNQVCTANAVAAWTLVHDSMAQATARDPQSAEIGLSAALRFFGPNWRPFLPRRQTMCGLQYKTKTTWEDPSLAFKGTDWNFYIVPQGHFNEIYKDAVALLTDHSDVWGCPDGPDVGIEHRRIVAGSQPGCMEAEVWPTPSLRDWLKADFQEFAPPDILICAYGPMVGDYVHGARPEVQPAEVVWWKHERKEHWTFLQVLDNSDRFGKDKNFSYPLPDKFKPWSSPRTDEMSLAVEIPLAAASPLFLHVEQDPNRHENDKHSDKARPGSRKEYTYQEKPVLIVQEEAEQRVNAVEPTEFCLDPSKQRLLGYLSLTATVGSDKSDKPDDPGKPGYQMTYVYQDGHDVPHPYHPPTEEASVEFQPQSMKIQQGAGVPQAVGDLLVKTDAPKPAQRLETYVEIATLNPADAAACREEAAAGGCLLRSVDLARTSALILGKDAPAPPRFTVRADIHQNLSAVPAPGAVGALAAFLGLRAPKAKRLLAAPVLKGNDVSFRTRCVSLSDEGAEPEEDSPRAVASTSKNPVEVVGGLKYQAFSCGAGAGMNCKPYKYVKGDLPSDRGHQQIYVKDLGTPVDPFQVRISWPTYWEDRLYKLIVTAELKSACSEKTVLQSKEFWNLAVPARDLTPAGIEKVIADVAAYAGIPAARIALPVDNGPLAPVLNTGYRRAVMLRAAVALFARDDGTISPDQMRQLVKAAQELDRTLNGVTR